MPLSTGAGVFARCTPMRLASGERPSNPSVLRWSTPRGRRRRASASPRTSSRNAPKAMPRSWRSLSEIGGSCSSGKYAPLFERGCSASFGFATAKFTTASERESGTRSSRIETPADPHPNHGHPSRTAMIGVQIHRRKVFAKLATIAFIALGNVDRL